MEPIINPTLFYWINVVDNTRGIILALMIFSMIALGVFLIVYIVTVAESGFEDESDKMMRKVIVISLILSILFTIVYVFLPSRDSLIEITIAQNLTTNNIESGIEAVKGVTDYIIEAIKEL